MKLIPTATTPPPPYLKNPCFYQKIQASLGDFDRIEIPASFWNDLEEALLPGPVILKTQHCESAVNLFVDDRGSAFLSGGKWTKFLIDNNFGEGECLFFTQIEGSMLDVRAIPDHVPHRDQDLDVAETSRSRKRKVTFAASSSMSAGISRKEDQDIVFERHVGKSGVLYKTKRPSSASARAAGIPIKKRGSSKPTLEQVPTNSPLGRSRAPLRLSQISDHSPRAENELRAPSQPSRGQSRHNTNLLRMPIIRERGSSKPTLGKVPTSSPLGFSSGSIPPPTLTPISDDRTNGRAPKSDFKSELALLQQEVASHEQAIKHHQHQLNMHREEFRKKNASITALMVKQMQKISGDYSDLKSFFQKED